MSIGYRIKQLRATRQLTMEQLAEALNIKTSNISRYENDKYLPSADTVIALSQFFNVTTDWILKGKDPIYSTKHLITENNLLDSFRKLSDIQKERTLERIEVYLEDLNDSEPENIKEEKEIYNLTPIHKVELWGDISAGGGIDAIVNREVIDAPVKCDFALRVRGDSMEPVFKNHSIIYLNKTYELRYNGEILAVDVDNSWAFLKKVYKEGNAMRLVSINSSYTDLLFPAERVDFWGKVVYPEV